VLLWSEGVVLLEAAALWSGVVLVEPVLGCVLVDPAAL